MKACFFTLCCVFTAMAATAPATAGEAAVDADPSVSTVSVEALGPNLRAQREEVEMHMADGRYAEISDRDKAAVLAAFDDMERLVGGASDVRALAPEQRAELLTAQERVNALLTQARADSRVVCKRLKVTGARARRTTICHTVAQWNHAAESSQEQMRLKQHSPMVGPDG